MAVPKLPPENSDANPESGASASKAGKIPPTNSGSSSPQPRSDAMNMMSPITHTDGYAHVAKTHANLAAVSANWQLAVAAVTKSKRRSELALRDYGAAERAFVDDRKLLDKERPKGVTFGIGDTVESGQARHATIVADIDRRVSELKHRLKYDELEKAAHNASVEHHEAVDTLLITTAPDLKAAVVKLEIAIDNGCEIVDLQPLLADLKRISKNSR